MISSIIIVGLTCLAMILFVLLKPQLKIGKIAVDSYWIVVLVGALVIIVSGLVNPSYLFEALTQNSSINPLKILVLFISMTMLSIFLDEVGFFRYLANLTLKKAKSSQMKLFVTLYVVVSILTVFTSNDIIVLTFTPFICYFAKNAKINPLPYLIAEFIAANTMSMTLIIGNPTNIYIATAYGVNFLDYLKVMFLPTLASTVVSFFILWLIFRKHLSVPAQANVEDVKITNKPYLIIGLIHLSVCTVALAVGPYVGLDMWIVSLVSALSLFLCIGIYSLVKKLRKKPASETLVCDTDNVETVDNEKPQVNSPLLNCLKRSPWQLIPFVLSMFVMILALQKHGVTQKINAVLGTENVILKYGITSFLSANLINNIPMSVLFCPIIAPLTGTAQTGALYATVVGSNLGALLTPIGALAGIMWTSMLKKHDVKLSYLNFIKYGVLISIPSLAVNLALLMLIL